jgi:hypothetical protein
VDKKQIFVPLTITDPLTGQVRVLSPEEQEAMLEQGILLPGSAIPSKSNLEQDHGQHA